MAKRKTAKPSAYRIIQVPIDPDLLSQIDEAADRVARSRAAYIRDACRHRLENEARNELERRYVEGYRGTPESRSWGVLGAKLLGRRLQKDHW